MGDDWQALGRGALGIMCGLPRAGKTTFAERLQDQGWVRVAADDVRRAYLGQAFRADAERLVWDRVYLMVRSLLIGGHLVVVDSTNITRAQRARWIAIARELNVTPCIFAVSTTAEVCLQRNHGEGAVPDEVILRMSRQYQAPDPSEGLDVYIVA